MRHLRTTDDPSHLIVLVRGGRGGRAHLGHAEEAALTVDRNPEQQVGEGEVGQQLPVTGDAVQVVDVDPAQAGVLLGEIAQR